MDFNNIPWQEILHYALIVLCSLSFLSLISLPIMSICGQILSLIRERSAYAKCAKQITLLAVYLAWIITLAGLVVAGLRVSPSILALINNPENATMGLPFAAYLEPIKQSIYLQIHVYTATLLLAATILLSFFYARWSVWQEQRIVLQCLAIVSSCWYAMSLYATLCIYHADSAFSEGITHPLSLNAFLKPSLESNIWNVVPYLLPLSFAFAGGLSCVWLIMRRKKDDFGRDYYAQMLPWCASWARNTWLFFWMMMLVVTGLQWIELLQQENYLTNPEFLRSVGFMLMWLIPGILWAIVIKSTHPLRHKATLFLAFLFSICSIVPLYIALQ